MVFTLKHIKKYATLILLLMIISLSLAPPVFLLVPDGETKAAYTYSTVTFGTGTNLIHGSTVYNGSLWFSTRTTSTRIIKMNGATLDYDMVILGSGYNNGEDIVGANDVLWVAIATAPVRLVKVYQNLTWQSAINFTAFDSAESLAYGYGFLWIGGQSKMAKVYLDTLSYWVYDYSSAIGSDYIYALTISGDGYIWATTASGKVLRFYYTVPGAYNSINIGHAISDDITYLNGHLYFGTEGSPYRIYKVADDLNYTYANIGSKCYGVTNDGNYIWAAYADSPGTVRRITQDLEVTETITLPTGFDSADELLFDSGYMFVTCWMSPARIVRYALDYSLTILAEPTELPSEYTKRWGHILEPYLQYYTVPHTFYFSAPVQVDFSIVDYVYDENWEIVWYFSHWEDNSTDYCRSVYVDSAITVTAYYESYDFFMLIVSANIPYVEVDYAYDGISDSATTMFALQVPKYTLVTLTMPTTWEDYDFDHWDDNSTNPVRVVNVSQYQHHVIGWYILPQEEFIGLEVCSDPLFVYFNYSYNGYENASMTPVTLYFDDPTTVTVTMPMIHTFWTKYKFSHWENGSPIPMRSVSVSLSNETTKISAYFILRTVYTLTVDSEPSNVGPFQLQYDSLIFEFKTPKTFQIYEDTSVTVITLYTGLYFIKWEDGSTDWSRTFIMTGNKNIIAYYTPGFKLVIDSVPSGVRCYLGAPLIYDYVTTPYIYYFVTPETIEITMPATWDGNNFIRWEDLSTDRYRALNITGDTTVIAYYVITAPSVDVIAILAVPLLLIFIPTFILAAKLGKIGFICGLGLGIILAVVAGALPFWTITILLIILATAWFMYSRGRE